MAFANKYFIASDCAVPVSGGGSNKQSKYAAAAARIVRGCSSPSEGMALREAPTRCFSSALTLGALSARDALDAARNRSPITPPLWIGDGKKKGTSGNIHKNLAGLFPSDNPLWGRSSEGSLSDVIEWREWFRLLAERSLSLQERGEPATSGGEKSMAGDPREHGRVNYWRFKDQHLVRYLTWPAGKDYDSKQHAPAMLLVHGFAASAEQWERLVYSLREENTVGGKDTTPPIYAVDLLGFGHSEKPGLSYTQYLWESQIVDFAVEIMEATPMIMVGNSIGGGLSAGAAASLGKKICKGLVLCNTAGVLEPPESYSGYKQKEGSSTQNDDIRSHTQAAMEGNPNEPYSPVPILGGNGLDLFGTGVIKLIYPQIEQRLSLIYGNRIENADAAVTYAIQQSAMHPGSANVIGSGQKLAPNRPLNEVLLEIDGGFNVLVVKGLEDQVSSPKVAKTRADLFSRLNPDKVIVDSIADAGHCPHDEQPAKVARSMVQWLATLNDEDSMEVTPQKKLSQTN
jgi:pimeloyl-ACP methyl ester carboxylesterase